MPQQHDDEGGFSWVGPALSSSNGNLSSNAAESPQLTSRDERNRKFGWIFRNNSQRPNFRFWLSPSLQRNMGGNNLCGSIWEVECMGCCSSGWLALFLYGGYMRQPAYQKVNIQCAILLLHTMLWCYYYWVDILPPSTTTTNHLRLAKSTTIEILKIIEGEEAVKGVMKWEDVNE